VGVAAGRLCVCAHSHARMRRREPARRLVLSIRARRGKRCGFMQLSHHAERCGATRPPARGRAEGGWSPHVAGGGLGHVHADGKVESAPGGGAAAVAVMEGAALARETRGAGVMGRLKKRARVRPGGRGGAPTAAARGPPAGPAGSAAQPC
jgi:hypothetical protein